MRTRIWIKLTIESHYWEKNELFCQERDRSSHKGLILSHVTVERLQIKHNKKYNWDFISSDDALNWVLPELPRVRFSYASTIRLVWCYLTAPK